MTSDAEYYLRMLLGLSTKITNREFETLQEAMILLEKETEIMFKVLSELKMEFESRHPRYFSDPNWESYYYDPDDDDGDYLAFVIRRG